jgi:hypothetical protein
VSRISTILLFLVIPGAVIAQDPCTPGQPEVCATTVNAAHRKVLERLAEVSVGGATQYQLASTPVPGFPVHIFRNGIELTPGSEYTMQESRVIPIGTTQSAGSIYEAAYVVSTQAGNAGVVASRGAQASDTQLLLNKFLQRSLRAELGYSDNEPAGATASSGEAGTTSRPQIASGPRKQANVETNSGVEHVAASGEPESMRMLRSIVLSRDRSARGSGVSQATEHIADGLEGVGDKSVNAPYELLIPRSASRRPSPRGLEKMSPPPKTNSTPDRELPFERLLRQTKHTQD